MAITIPQDAVKTFEKVMGALGGEDYSYYLFDVKNVNEKPKAKKVVEMVVYVPEAKRVTAAANIQESLDGDGVIAEVLAKETELDVYLIGDTKKYIRILVKPNGSKGSGGGSAATSIQEAAQCVYAAMRYYCGEKEIYTEEDLKCGMKYTSAPGVKLEDIDPEVPSTILFISLSLSILEIGFIKESHNDSCILTQVSSFFPLFVTT